MKNKKSHCINGHEYTPDNTLYRKNGYKYCRACKKGRLNDEVNQFREVWLCKKVSRLVQIHNIIRQSAFGLRASEIRNLRIGALYRAEIRAAQTGNHEEGTHMILAEGSRLSA